MAKYDKADLERRMKGAVEALKHDLSGLRTAIDRTLVQDRVRTGDLGGSATTAQYTRAVISRLA